jgi:hypothetical protein
VDDAVVEVGAATVAVGVLPWQRAEPRVFVADMAVSFLFCNAFAIALIGLSGGLDLDRLGAPLAWWLPGALPGNAVGMATTARGCPSSRSAGSRWAWSCPPVWRPW